MPTLDELAAAPAAPPIRLPVGDNLRRPWCHNRPDYSEGEWVPRQGYHEVQALMLLQRPSDPERIKPRFRWRWRKMSTDCRAWSTATPTETPAPVLDRYDCRGCRHMPPRARHHFHPED